MEILAKLREQIDDIDKRVLELFAKRQVVVKQIGRLKKEHNLSVIDLRREQQKIEQLGKLALENNIDVSFVKNIWQMIFSEARKLQQ